MSAIFKRPRYLVLFACLILWAVGYFGAVGLDHLQAHDPPKHPPNMFDGRFDGVIIFMLCPMMFVGFYGSILSALWCAGRLMFEIVFYVCSKKPAA